MGMLKIDMWGSFPVKTQAFAAQEKGHAVAVEDAIKYLTDEVLPYAIRNDSSCKADGALPDDRFAEANKRGSLLPRKCGIGWALKQMQHGSKVRRRAWAGDVMFIVLMPELSLPPHSSQEPGAKVNDRTAKHIGKDTPLNSQPYIAMAMAGPRWLPGWVCSQGDLLARDWEVIE